MRPLVKFSMGILIVYILLACESGSQGRGLNPDDYIAGTKLINVGLCVDGPGETELKSMELVTRDQSGAITIVVSGYVDRGGTYTAKLPNGLKPGWYALRVNNLANMNNVAAGDLMPVYVDISDFNILYILVRRNIRKAVESFDQPAVCNIYNTKINDWFIENHAGKRNIRKYSNSADAEPVSHAFFAFRQSDSMLFIGRMLDMKIIQTLPRPSQGSTKPNNNHLSRTKWIMRSGEKGGHQLHELRDIDACFGCHENGDMKPVSFPATGTSNICHRCHAGAVGYTNGLYDPAQ